MTPVFLITIDTEGDNIWDNPSSIKTENARFLPRFQALCERHGLKPTYLTNYEMAIDPTFQAFGREVARNGTAEIGLHVHAWNSPPLTGKPKWDHEQVYITDLPEELIHEKNAFLTKLLADTFEVTPVSHRAGRWGFDSRVARSLVSLGYLIDCSVSPGVSWRRYKGVPDGQGGPSYFGFPIRPYFLDTADIRREGSSTLLEVPVTIRPNYPRPVEHLYHRTELGFVGKVLRKFVGPPYQWLRPTGENLEQMLAVVDWALDSGLSVLEFMLHSSEFMPGGSPNFTDAAAIERLYEHLDRLFAHVTARGVTGATMAEYRRTYPGAPAPAARSASVPSVATN